MPRGQNELGRPRRSRGDTPAQRPGRVMTMVTVGGGARETAQLGTGNSGRQCRGGDDDGGTDGVTATQGKRLGDGDERSARGQRRRSTATWQDGLDGKKRASPMGTRGSPAALDHGDGEAHQPGRRRNDDDQW
ncbi:hypothetical protein E2562_019898 [Oryza meyeriana var. granulata]|uniref:Uncharacterized protein n=1 Tax=Oryza meyeriana var. granulata TaxID=110450 RepID=A0A6G1EXI0_9ORYZ|nr:hypothetical protein E2562_019898 [Oryza meyeriana var. granulata]